MKEFKVIDIKGIKLGDGIVKILSLIHIYTVLNVALIIFFTYFYTAITFNPVEIANNMKNNGGFIPGIRPGRPTAEYLTKVMTRIAFVGAIFLAVIAVMLSLIHI